MNVPFEKLWLMLGYDPADFTIWILGIRPDITVAEAKGLAFERCDSGITEVINLKDSDSQIINRLYRWFEFCKIPKKDHKELRKAIFTELAAIFEADYEYDEKRPIERPSAVPQGT